MRRLKRQQCINFRIVFFQNFLWFSSPWGVRTNLVDFQDISDLFMAIFASLCIECIWKERNKIIHDKVKSPIDQIIRELRLMMESYSVDILPSPVGSTDLQRLWLSPPGRWIKCNVDAAVRSSFSVTARIARRVPLLACSQRGLMLLVNKVAEVLALLQAIKFAIRLR